MPQCCIGCPIYNGEYGQCKLIPYSKDTDEEPYDPFEERSKDCPLSEVNWYGIN